MVWLRKPPDTPLGIIVVIGQVVTGIGALASLTQFLLEKFGVMEGSSASLIGFLACVSLFLSLSVTLFVETEHPASG